MRLEQFTGLQITFLNTHPFFYFRTGMKKAVALLFLPVFLFSILGWQWMFLLKLFSHEMEEWSGRNGTNNLEVVIVSASEKDGQNYFLNEHELMHDGKLYD